MESRQILIITNNPAVKDIKDVEIYFIQGTALQVFYHVYHRTAAGHSLLSHPLSGSFKPGGNPYRSMVLNGFKTVAELPVLNMLEKCITMLENSTKDTKRAEAMNAFASDYQQIDRYLLESTLQSLREVRCY